MLDIAKLGRPAGSQAVSLRRMAEEHLGETIQQAARGGAGRRRHCAIEDAAVTMRLYHALTRTAPAGTTPGGGSETE